MKRVVTKKLGQLLIENGIITESQLAEALSRQQVKGGYLGQNLVEMGYTTEEEIVSCLTVQYGYPYLPLRNYEINKELIKLIPRELAERFYIIPIDKIGDVLTVTMANPLEEEAMTILEKAIGCRIEAFVSTGSEIAEVLREYYGISLGKKETSQMLTDVDMQAKDKKN
jgi:type IV pilus assembly protein PilB